MAIKTSTILGNGRDDDRISGFSKATLSGATAYNGGIDQLIGGLVVCQDNSDITGKTLKLFQGAVALGVANPLPLGLVSRVMTDPVQEISSDIIVAGELALARFKELEKIMIDAERYRPEYLRLKAWLNHGSEILGV